MAALNHFLLAVIVFLVFACFDVTAEESIADVDPGPRSDAADSALLEDLKFRIQNLEHQVGEKTKEIMDKDTVIAAKEKLIKEKLDRIVSLEGEIASLQKMRNLNAVEVVGRAQARASELERKVEEFKSDLIFNIKEKETLKSRLTGAERKASELNSKLNSLQKIIDGQKIELHKTEHALRLAEEELTMAKLEATSKDMELLEVHSAWLPPWLAADLIHSQTLLEKNWQIHGKPAVELLRQKAIEKKAHFKEWAAPHVETMETEWVPAIKEQWVAIANNMEPHVQTITKKTIEIYETSEKAVTPHIIRVLEAVDPYFQQLTEVSKPYIDQVATAAKPHVDALDAALKPYTEWAIHTYGKFLESATIYHNHVQDRVEEKLKSHELTKPLATKELIWFTASALLALPVLFLLNIFSVVYGQKSQKPIQHSNTHHSQQKTEHRHAPSKVQKGSDDCIAVMGNRTISRDISFYEDTIRTTVTCDPSTASQWISDLYSFHRHSPNIMVGLDIEWRPPHSRKITNPVATLQLCIDNRCLILQLIHCPYIPPAITNFFENPSNTFVGVRIKEDLQKLEVDYDFGLIATAVDLREEVAVAFETPELRKAGLKTLAAVVLGKEVDKPKSVTVSEWDNRWLTESQIRYACIDAFVCYDISRALLEGGHTFVYI